MVGMRPGSVAEIDIRLALWYEGFQQGVRSCSAVELAH